MIDIGDKIKRTRLKLGLTQEELAARTELSKGFISQLERNLTSPSISTLEDILEALGSSLSDFFKEEKDEQTVFQKKDFFIDERDECTINWIVPNTQKNDMEPILIEIPQGGKSFNVNPHGGEEFGYVVDGSAILVVGDKRYSIKKGETFYMTGKDFHYILNEKKTAAKIIWVSTPPLF